MINPANTLGRLADGGVVAVVDTRRRAEPIHLVACAAGVTPERLQALARQAAAPVYLALADQAIGRLALPPGGSRRVRRHGPPLVSSIDAARGLDGAGSPGEQARTIRAAIAPEAVAGDVVSPGHVLVAAGEAAGDDSIWASSLVLADAVTGSASALVAEVSGSRGADVARTLRSPSLNDISVLEVAEATALASQRSAHQAACRLPTLHGAFSVHGALEHPDGTATVILTARPLRTEDVVRVHVGCLLGEALGGALCACAHDLERDFAALNTGQVGALVYTQLPHADVIRCPAADPRRGDVVRLMVGVAAIGAPASRVHARQDSVRHLLAVDDDRVSTEAA